MVEMERPGNLGQKVQYPMTPGCKRNERLKLSAFSLALSTFLLYIYKSNNLPERPTSPSVKLPITDIHFNSYNNC